MLKFFGNLFDSNEKQIRLLNQTIEQVNSFESKLSKFSIDKIKLRLDEIRKDFLEIYKDLPNEHKDSINVIKDRKDLSLEEKRTSDLLFQYLPEVFAIVREIAKRTFDRRHYDVQLMSGIVLAQGKISEMKTGEGKTQVAWLPLALYALTGRGAHLVTVNDYLAKAHGEYAGHIFTHLRMSVGIVTTQQSYRFIPDSDVGKVKGEEVMKERKKVKIQNPGDVNGWNLVECSKKEAYGCDVVYGTNNEFGFDYLRDNMAQSVARIVQKELFYCIVDEVDSILIDEARTPLIISAPAEKSNDLYTEFARLIPRLKPESDYMIDEKARSAVLTDEGIEKVERWLGVGNLWEDYRLAHHLENGLKAYALFKRDDDYMVSDGEVIIIDEFTGRAMPGRRYSEGLHQAIEAKEGVDIKQESRTLATITFQNFFRIYKHLAGMTGTAETESEEFYKIYQLEVIVVPTNKDVIRIDHIDRVYKNQKAKFDAVIEEIKEFHKKGQPVLVGTTSVEKSEYLSSILVKQGIKHEVLNAKYHEKESKIIAQAGRKGAVTIATNMAGRGTDIKLGGDPFEDKKFNEVVITGGLHVIGTERHESRRIDNQLRGRSGRQGEPGSSRFFIALDDEIMRVQGGMVVQSLMESIKVPDDMPIESRIISSTIEKAQKRVEGYNFDTRKHLVEYDDVMNQQREIFYRIHRKRLHQLDQIEADQNGKTIQEIEDEMFSKIERELDQLVQKHFLPDRDDSIDTKNAINDLLDLAPDELFMEGVNQADAGVNVKILTKLQPMLLSYLDDKSAEEITKFFKDVISQLWSLKKIEVGEEKEFVTIVIRVFLQTFEELWSEHLNNMQDLREGIGLRGVAQRDPLIEYKNEAIGYFDSFMRLTDSQFSHRIFKVRKIQQNAQEKGLRTNTDAIEEASNSTMLGIERIRKKESPTETVVKSLTQDSSIKSQSTSSTSDQKKKIGRNDPCWCGSGKKYKKCHGRT